MIPEVEVIEQIEDEPTGRPLAWVCRLLTGLGCAAPMQTLHGMVRGGQIVFVDADGRRLPEWECAALLRGQRLGEDLYVLATEEGSRWAHRC